MALWVHSVVVHRVAGYEAIQWNGLDPALNLLLGMNGAGKSTVLQALGMTLHYLRGQSTDKLFSANYRGSSIDIRLNVSGEKREYSFEFFKINRGKRPPLHNVQIIQYVENRQPQNRMGKHPHKFTQHPMERYPKTMSGLMRLHEAGEAEELSQIFAVCRQVLPGGSWEHVESAVGQGRPLKMRPSSCGEFDLVALVLDLIRARSDIPTVCIIDNPDLYLHPAGQQALLEVIRSRLPDAQVICATHSLKLLCVPEQKGVFWLSRERAAAGGGVEVVGTRYLRGAAEEAFYELYGADVSSATLNLLRGLEGLEYFRFLLECVLESEEIARKDPRRDPQVEIVISDLALLRGPRTVVDIGPGTGDLIEALRCLHAGNKELRYVGVIKPMTAPASLLEKRLKAAKAEGMVAPTSMIVDRVADCPRGCAAVYVMNVLHELPLDDVAHVLADLLSTRLSSEIGSRLIIVEQVMLQKGEIDFIMWNGEDYAELLADVPRIDVGVRRGGRPGGPPVEATIITRQENDEICVRPEQILGRLRRHLPVKRSSLLDRIRELRSEGVKEGLAEVVRQREHAFCVAQLATIDLLIDGGQSEPIKEET